MESEPLRRLALAFREAVSPTGYYRDHMHGDGPIPRTALQELAVRACLRRLPEFPEERRAIQDDLFSVGSGAGEPTPRLVDQRRRSFAYFLSLADADSRI